MIYSQIISCRVCKNSVLIDVVDLGDQKITSRFPIYGDHSTPSTPICLCLCEECGLLQLKIDIKSSELYEHEYGYRSGINESMQKHLKCYQEEVVSKIVNPREGDIVLDIGSNDSTMLQFYPKSMRKIGVDPTGKQFHHLYPADIELLPDFFTKANVVGKFGTDMRCKVISSISMFYDLPDPVQFARDIFDLLEDDGVWTLELSYVLFMMNTNSIDTICHEHLEYYSLTSIKAIFDAAGFRIVDLGFNDCNGGSFRIYLMKKSFASMTEDISIVKTTLAHEESIHIKSRKCYQLFQASCDHEINKFNTFLQYCNNSGKSVWIYGASTKGNTFLQYAGIGEEKIKYAVERNHNKFGKSTSTGIEIISEETMRGNPPPFLLVLPWHFKDGILQRERSYLESGGQMVFVFPKFEIVGNRQKMLLTGSDGMIAQYVLQSMATQKYHVYGTVRPATMGSVPSPRAAAAFTAATAADVVKCPVDVTSHDGMELLLHMIKPDVVIHLASISSSAYALDHPMDAMQTNGLAAAQICDIIYQMRTKLDAHYSPSLFHASSSEIYKGHVDYEVKEDDHAVLNNHPYSVAKIMASSMVDFYRETHGMRFSNGVIFTTESVHKAPVFLMSKLAKHVKGWTKQGKHVPATIGPLGSFRNLLHASDVAKAILCIVEQPVGANYLICSDQPSIKVEDLVLSMYRKAGLPLHLKGSTYFSEADEPVLVNSLGGNDAGQVINIRGYPHKLLSIGWRPATSIAEIIDEFLEVRATNEV